MNLSKQSDELLSKTNNVGIAEMLKGKMKQVVVKLPSGEVVKKRGYDPPKFAIIARRYETEDVWEQQPRKDAFGEPIVVRVFVGDRRKNERGRWEVVEWAHFEDQAENLLFRVKNKPVRYSNARITRTE